MASKLRGEETSAASGTWRVLFIGNSLTYYNGGVDEHLARMCGALTSEAVTRGGATLSKLWRKVGACKKKIRTQRFNFVVLQDDIPELKDPEDFRKFAEKFVALARECEAKPVLFMCWAYERLAHRVSHDTVIQMHRSVGRDLRVDVVPVGCARSQLPNMWADDMEHPSLQSTVLAAAMILKSLLPQRSWDPKEYLPEGLTLTEAEEILRVSESMSPPADWSWSSGQNPLKVRPSARDDCTDHGAINESKPPAAVKHLLDEHVVFSIASLLPAEDLASMAVVCMSIHNVVCLTHAFDTNVWKRLCQCDFGLFSRGRQTCWRLAYLAEQADRAILDAQIMIGMC